MKLIAAIVLPLSLVVYAPEPAEAQQTQPRSAESKEGAGQMEISRSDTRQPSRGPAQYFTGTATITPLFNPEESSQVGAALVTFEPGARTAWHTHPLGQRLVVISGTARVRVEGGPIEEIRAGDAVWFPPNVRHWHGASPDSSMSHIAIQQSQDGSSVTWMEHVTDEQYRAGARGE